MECPSHHLIAVPRPTLRAPPRRARNEQSYYFDVNPLNRGCGSPTSERLGGALSSLLRPTVVRDIGSRCYGILSHDAEASTKLDVLRGA